MKAIPAPLKTMIQQYVLYSSTIPEIRSLCIEGISLKSKQFTNKFIRQVLSKEYFLSQLKRKYVLQEFSEEEAKKIRKRYLTYPILPKAKEVTFKILNDIYPSNNFLHEIFNWENNSCMFCEKDIETVEDMFFQCELVQNFWLEFQNWLHFKQISIHPLTVVSIKVGVLLTYKNIDFLINNLIILCKNFIHRCKYLKVKPHFSRWKNELKIFAKSLNYMKDKNAQKLLYNLSLYLLIE